MYTVEEIEEKAKAQGTKTFWIWVIVMGIIAPICLPLVGIIMGLEVHFDSVSWIDYGKFILGGLPIVVISGLLMSSLSKRGIKKKLMEKNEEEERKERDKHYRKMEELLEKMSKEKENE